MSRKFEDLTGQKFGKLVVLFRTENKIESNGRKRVMWHCKCDCGNETDVRASDLKMGKIKSCGCLKKINPHKLIDLSGKTYGRLTVIERCEDHISKSGYKSVMWKCICECGHIIKVSGNSLKSGKTKSCGCLQNEMYQTKEYQDLSGQRFGRLVVLERSGDYINPQGKKSAKLLCKCDCGNTTVVLASSLKSGRSESCGCLRSEMISIENLSKIKDLTGQKFGKLTPIKRVENHIDASGHQATIWECQCDCGNITNVFYSSLLTGSTKSCGCMRSVGEYNINTYLTSKNINFYSQIKFEGLIGIGGKSLSYDFYLPDYHILIEAQGKQHEQPIKYFGGHEHFKIQQEHDKRKREYAEKNGYKLLEIWYYDYDKIEEILSRELELD